MNKKEIQNEMLYVLEWVTRCASMRGPAGTRPRFISDEIMERAKAVVSEAKKRNLGFNLNKEFNRRDPQKDS